MRIEGGNGAPLSPGSSTCTDDMIENENESLRERVADLEKRVLDQGDEIVCLRSTLADVLRRLNHMEALRGPPVSVVNHVTPTKDGTRLRHHVTSDHTPREPPSRRITSYTPPHQLPQRRATHYQSTNSLHSDSPSSQSASPAPSPSPTHTPQRSSPAPRSSYSSRGQHSPSASSLQLAKRWSSTGDFNNGHHVPVLSPGTLQAAKQLATKSLFNLHMRAPQIQFAKHGTREAVYNEEDGYVRMYLRGRPINLYVPSSQLESYDVSKVETAPSSKLKLEWVFGYRGRDCRNNLYLLPTGEMVYFNAAVVILYNVEEQTQRHYLGHTDDVKCMAIHPNKLLIASGQTAGHDRREGRPHIRIWNSVSLHTMHVIGIGEFERSVCCVTFSKADGGALLCAVDEAPDHNISIWDWQKGERGQKITETKCSADTVVAAEFHPLDRQTIVTSGKNHISFWSLEGGTLSRRLGLFEGREKPKYVTCLAFTQDGDTVSGDSNGNILLWGRGTNTVAKMVRGVHEGAIFSVCVLKDGSVVTGGGKDGRLVLFDPSLSKTGVENQIPDDVGSVRAIAEGRGGRLLIGTTKNCIVGGSLELGFSQPAVWGHTDEVWALCCHPTLPQFVSAGYDHLLQLWDSQSHAAVWTKDLGEGIQSASFSTDGSILIIGFATGKWLVMDPETREVLASHVDGNEHIQVTKFSPDGNLLALGSRDNNIYIYQVSEEFRKYSRVGRCTGHSSFITHLDWSVDSTTLRSNSGDYELLYWNPGVCRQIVQSSTLRDTEWASHTCTLSFETIGIWPEGADGTDVNHCASSHDNSLIATGDDFGKVKLYSFPASQPRSLCHTYGGHSSHVTKVRFLNDDTRLITAGGRDTSVMQWMLC